MRKRFCLLAKYLDGRFYYLTFNNPKILDCLDQIPSDNGLLALAKWPIYDHVEIEFFVELINGNFEYYKLRDRDLDTEKKVSLQ